MSSTNGSEPVGQRPRRPTPTSTDPEVLAAEIERTREDLAETLDAIADRVSPKRVADRTRKQVTEAVATAKEVVAGQAGVAKEKAAELVAGAKEKASGAATVAKDRAVEAREKVSGSSGAHAGTGGSVALSSTGASPVAPGEPAPLPPVTAVQADGLDLSLGTATTTPTPTSTPGPTSTSPTPPAGSPSTGPSPEVLAGGALGLLVLLLLRRRRTKRKALKTGAVAALAAAGAEMRSDFDSARRSASKKARKKGRRRR